jgi:hypothetical protein
MPTVSKGPSNREWFLLHAEVQALQQMLGLSYKDAAHRLYMAELERVKATASAARAFLHVRKRLDRLVVDDIITPINSIDEGQWDGLVFKDGQWQDREEM